MKESDKLESKKSENKLLYFLFKMNYKKSKYIYLLCS